MKLFKLSLKERKGDLTMAKKANSLAHTKWMCKYHIVFTPKYRRKVIYNQYKESIRDILKQLCAYKGVEIIEGHLMPDHIHMLVSIPPKYSVSQFMGYLKGKSALMIYDKHANLMLFSRCTLKCELFGSIFIKCIKHGIKIRR